MRILPRWTRRRRSRNKPRPPDFPQVYTEEEKAVYLEVAPFTMTDQIRILALMHAVRYVVRQGLPGAIVECGVWKGGSMMAVARTLSNLGVNDRELYLFDTFEGMSAPTDKDVDYQNEVARVQYEETKFEDREGSDWCYSPLDEVKRNVESVGYPAERIHYVKGKVEDVLPEHAVDPIALLRLDTDWYESTLAEMKHLYPNLVQGGVLILDDYYTWHGSKQAVDEYVAERSERLFFTPIGGAGAVVATKP